MYTTPAIVVPVFQGLGPWHPLSSSMALRLHRLKSKPPSDDILVNAILIWADLYAIWDKVAKGKST